MFKLQCLLYNKVVAVVHDHGSNMQVFLRYFDSGWASVNCVAHTLQLCINEGLQLPSIAALLGAGRKLVGHFKHSSKATAALAQKQKQMNIRTCEKTYSIPSNNME